MAGRAESPAMADNR